MQDTLQENKGAALADGTVISHVQKEYYSRDGFLVLKHFIPAEIGEWLMERARQLINQFDPKEIKAVFSTKDPRHARQRYFLESSDKIHFFFEETALDEHGKLKSEKLCCINKIGHALHEHDPVFYCFSRQHKIAALIHDLGVKDPVILQSMYLCKQPFFGGEVACHQDSSYLFTHGQPVTGLWLALEDATIENGCLWAIPGSHRDPLKSRMVRDVYDRVSTEVYDNTPWNMAKMIPLEVPRGSLILLHGMLAHMSKDNISSRSRHAYSLHVMSGSDPFAANNWLKHNPEQPFSRFV